MTDKEKQDWLKVKYPITIIRDRYEGTYSGALWLVFPVDYNEIPEGVDGDDVECAEFWESYKEPVGKGTYPNDALADLLEKMNESEDEKIIEQLLYIVKDYQGYAPKSGLGFKECLAWLEKQKEQKPKLEVFGFKVGDAVRLKDGDGRKHIIKSFEEVEGIHGPNFYHVEFEDNSASDGIYPGEEYPNGYYTQMEKFEEEQKPSWSEEDEKVYDYLKGGFEYATGNPDLLKSTLWGKSDATVQDYRNFIDKLKILRPQPKQDWSEEDKKMLEDIIDVIQIANAHGYRTDDSAIKEEDWLKSLHPQPQHRDTYYDIIHNILDMLKDMDFMKITPEHRVSLLNDIRVKCKNADECATILDEPHWKPSEKEITAFENMLKGEFPDGIFPGVTLSELLAKLKRLYYNESIPSWKPSEEQIEALKYVNEYVFLKDSCKRLGLKTLYEDLKKQK